MSSPRRALIVIDVQQQYFDGVLTVEHPPRDESVARIAEAIDAAVANQVPVVVVQHELPAGAPVFATGSESQQLHPEIDQRAGQAAKRLSKSFGSVFADTDLLEWLRGEQADTVTLVGYMTNNCVLASAAAAEPLGLSVEVLSDATGAIPLSNDAGAATAAQVHETLMTLLNSNWAAVTTTEHWLAALEDGRALQGGSLVESAMAGRATA